MVLPEERKRPVGRIEVAVCVARKGKLRQMAVFSSPIVLFKERRGSNGCVVSASGVEQKCRLRQMAVFGVCRVEKQGSGAGSGVEAPAAVLKSEYQPTPVFADAGGKVLKGHWDLLL